MNFQCMNKKHRSFILLIRFFADVKITFANISIHHPFLIFFLLMSALLVHVIKKRK